MVAEKVSEEFLLPYEWPGSYFIGEEEIEAVTIRLAIRSRLRIGSLSRLAIISAAFVGVGNKMKTKVAHDQTAPPQ